MQNLPELFHRPELAAAMATNILVVSPGSSMSSGVFLAAPRRTGKSTFMREDLRPAFEAKGAVVLYADLWANPTADPGEVIVQTIRNALAKEEGVMLRLAKKIGMDKVNVSGINIDLGRIGLGKDISLTDAFVVLSEHFEKMIVLVIDEAQHAITSEEGVAALFALKAARDELNSSQHHGLRIVCTGSNRDKLAMLRTSKDQAFFGAPMVNFPMLDKNYVEWFCERAGLNFKLDPEVVFTLFKETGNRPELLGAAADVVRMSFIAEPTEAMNLFVTEVRNMAADLNQSMLDVVHSLTPIQSAVLRVMAASGKNYAPFEAATMERYNRAMGLAGTPKNQCNADTPNVQQALLALQDKKLVWKAARGVYAIEEDSIVKLLTGDGLLKDL